MARPSCFKLLAHLTRLAASRTFCTAGSNSPIKTAMMAMTTNNSIRVKPPRFLLPMASSQREEDKDRLSFAVLLRPQFKVSVRIISRDRDFDTALVFLGDDADDLFIGLGILFDDLPRFPGGRNHHPDLALGDRRGDVPPVLN